MRERITAEFPSRDEAAAALGRLRIAGAVSCDVPLPIGHAGMATVRLTVRGHDAPLAKAIIRGAGGTVRLGS